ncbi:hypothetical protein ACVRZG_10210 [Streptococcus hyovaginalis]|nr:hypothetical protein [Streptococcus hyovaginalis]
MTVKQTLTKAEKEFLETYHSRSYHYFKDIKKYVALLEKLTKV